MERENSTNSKLTFIVIAVLYGVGIAGHLIPLVYPLMLFLTPYTLMLTGFLVIYPELTSQNNKFIMWLAATYIITFIIEAIGVETGLIFGEYVYGNVLGLKIFNTPLIIGFNWVLVIWGAIQLVKFFTTKKVLIILFASLLAVFFDFIMEPAAVQMGYWIWEAGIIPMQNYIAWFVIAVLFSGLYLLFGIKTESKLPGYYFLIQLIFFIALNLFL